MINRHGYGNQLYHNSRHTVRGLHIPSRYVSILSAVGKHSAAFNRVCFTRLKLDPRYWGEVEQDGSPLKQPTCVYFDLFERIASKCLGLKNIANFKTGNEEKPVVDVLDSFHAGEFAKEIRTMMKHK
jgi:hypothetical protein